MTSPQFAQIGNRIRSARLAAALTQQQVADRIGVTKNTVSEIERGREPSLSVLLEMARALDVSVVGFLTDAGTTAPPSAPQADEGDGTSVLAVPAPVLRAARQQLETLRAVTAAQEQMVASLALLVRHEERLYTTDPQLLEDAAADVMRDAARVAQAQDQPAAPKRKRKSAG